MTKKTPKKAAAEPAKKRGRPPKSLNAAAKPPKKPRGGQVKPLDYNAVEQLAALQCTYEELAAFFGVAKRTIVRRAEEEAFRDAIERGKTKGLISLRRAQYQTAVDGDRTMLVWLGKQWLNQKDKTEIEHTGGISVVVERLQAARARLAANIGIGGVAGVPSI